jgi:hypothetical protein
VCRGRRKRHDLHQPLRRRLLLLGADLLRLGLRAGRLGHVALLLDAFTLDLNVIPGDVQANRDPELMLGFSSGLTVGVFF